MIPIAINASIDNKLALRKRPYSDANQSPSKVNVRLMVITDAMIATLTNINASISTKEKIRLGPAPKTRNTAISDFL